HRARADAADRTRDASFDRVRRRGEYHPLAMPRLLAKVPMRSITAALVVVLLGIAVSRMAAAPDSADVLPWNRKPMSWAVQIAPAGEPGPRLVISGRIMGKGDVPMPNVTMYAYHADAHGLYWRLGDEPYVNRLSAVLRSDAQGEYLIRTIVPGLYE